jgi:hypothetical protein
MGFLLETKDQAKIHIDGLIRRLNNLFQHRGYRVKYLHADGGGEFIDFDLSDLCSELGIHQEFTNPYSPEENAIAERANGVILVKIRAVLHMTGLPDMMWGLIFLFVIHTTNVTSSKSLEGRTPHELLYNEVPDVTYLRSWGCIAYATIFDKMRNNRNEKLKSRVVPALFVGYSTSTKGYLLLEIPSCKILKHRAENVKFMKRFTLSHRYAEMMLLNAFRYGDHDLPAEPELVPIKISVSELAHPPVPPPVPAPARVDPVGARDESVEASFDAQLSSRDPEQSTTCSIDELETVAGGRSKRARRPSLKVRENGDRLQCMLL